MLESTSILELACLTKSRTESPGTRLDTYMYPLGRKARVRGWIPTLWDGKPRYEAGYLPSGDGKPGYEAGYLPSVPLGRSSRSR